MRCPHQSCLEIHQSRILSVQCKVGLVHTLRQQLDVSVLYRFHCRFDHIIHLYEPLLLDHRLYRSAAAVMGSYIMRMRNDLYEQSLLF